MCANVELDIFLKKGAFSLNQLFSLLEVRGLHVNFKEMCSYDDWEFTNGTSIDPGSFDKDTSDLFLKKFTCTYFTVNNKWRCSLLTSLEDTCMQLSFGLNTDDLLRPGETDYEDAVIQLYDHVADSINDAMSKDPLKGRFLVASMGVEYSIGHFQSDITTMVDNDNAPIWIVPKESGKHIPLKNFEKEEKSDTIVFRKNLENMCF